MNISIFLYIYNVHWCTFHNRMNQSCTTQLTTSIFVINQSFLSLLNERAGMQSQTGAASRTLVH